MPVEVDAANLVRGKFDSGGIAAGIERGSDRESGAGVGLTDLLKNRWIINEGLASPLLADFGEESVLDRIPLGGTAWVVANGDGESEGIGEPLLQGVFPKMGVGAVAAAVVGEDE